MPQVLFAGYKVPHPLHPYFILKIQTDGTITPEIALEQACAKLISNMSTLERKFDREFTDNSATTVAEGPYGMTPAPAGDPSVGGKDYLDF
jgi:DNA-directed RNA polymerase II subunit RPB11